jgi:hypothetical protein
MIFLSYSHRDSILADDIDIKFRDAGYELTRDIRDIGYKQSIREFMKKIRNSDYAIMLLTENYFKSSNCMFELLEFLKETNYPERIIPLIKKSSNIITDDGIIEYIQYWENEKKKLQKKMKQINYASLGKLSEKLKHYVNICNSIAKIGDELMQKNNIVFEENMNDNNYREIFLYMRIPYTKIKEKKIYKKQDKNKIAKIGPENNIQNDINIAIKCLLPILHEIENTNETKIIYIADYLSLYRLSDWVICITPTVLKGNMVSTVLQKRKKMLIVHILVDKNLFLDDRETKEKKHVFLTKSVCHIFAYMCSYLSAPEKIFFSKLIKIFDYKINNIGNHNSIDDKTKNMPPSELLRILKARDEHFRMGFEKVNFDYILLFKKLLYSNELFEKYFDNEKQKLFKELFDSYRTDDSLELLFSFCEEYSLKKSIPVDYIKKDAIEIIHKYF